MIDNDSAFHGWPDGIERRFMLEGWTALRVDGRDHEALEAALAPDPEADAPALHRRGGQGEMTTMRERFYDLAREALDEDERVAVVTAQIGNEAIGEHPRHFDVGIREQLMIGVAAGLALEGYRPIAHSYTPFLVERPYEMLKLDLGHNDLGAVLVSIGASYDAAHEGRTHQAPEDVALVAALPGWTIHVPGHVDEADRLFRQALGGDGRTYLRLSEETNHARVDPGWLTVLRHGSSRRAARCRGRPDPDLGPRGDLRP